jgi:outer membrane protein TolC
MLHVGAETRRSWFRTVAADELGRYRERVVAAAEASAELSRRMAQVGNVSGLDQMREQVFYAEALAQLAQARQEATAAREQLTRLMGLHGEDIRFRLPERLPELPASPAEFTELESRAIAQRVDVLSARRDAESLAGSLGLTKATRVINVLELGPAATKEDPEGWKRGVELSLELPIFDWGGARVAKAEAIYMRAVHRVAETAVNARSEVREAYSAYRTAYDAAKHYRDEIVPLRRRIADENLLRYNGMLIGVFDLLADARAQIASVGGYVEALRDFWIAEADLGMAMIGRAAPPAVARAAMPQAESGGGH